MVYISAISIYKVRIEGISLKTEDWRFKGPDRNRESALELSTEVPKKVTTEIGD
jgi:hypothetical protein